MPLWLIGLLLRARKIAGAVFRFMLEPFGVVLPVGVWMAVLVGLLVVVKVNYAAARREGRAQVQATIDAPVTGWRARLDQCHTSEATLRTGLDQQNAAMQKRSLEASATLAAQVKTLRGSQPAVTHAAAVAASLAKPLTAPDACARVFEVDRRFVETLR